MEEGLSADQCLQKGLQLFNQEQFEQARSYLENAAEYDPVAFNYYKLGLCYMKLDMHEAALQAFQSSTIMDEKQWQAQILQGSLLYDLGNYSSALEAFFTALQHYREFDIFDQLKLKILEENKSQLRDFYLKIGDRLAMEKNNRYCMMYKAIVGTKLGKFEEATHELAKLTKLYNEDTFKKHNYEKNRLDKDYYKLKVKLQESTYMPKREMEAERFNEEAKSQLQSSQQSCEVSTCSKLEEQPLQQKQNQNKQSMEIRNSQNNNNNNHNYSNSKKNSQTSSKNGNSQQKEKEKDFDDKPCCRCVIF